MIWGQPAGKFVYNPRRCATCGEIFDDAIALLRHSLKEGTEHPGFECQTRNCRKRFVDYNVAEVEHGNNCRPAHLAKSKPIWVCHRVEKDCSYASETEEELEKHAEKHEPFVCREKECTLEADSRLFKSYDTYKAHLKAAEHV